MARDYFAEFRQFRGNADTSAAEDAFYAVADKHGLTYADLTAEWPSDAAKEAYSAAVCAAWPNRINFDPSYEGSIEVFEL